MCAFSGKNDKKQIRGNKSQEGRAAGQEGRLVRPGSTQDSQSLSHLEGGRPAPLLPSRGSSGVSGRR